MNQQQSLQNSCTRRRFDATGWGRRFDAMLRVRVLLRDRRINSITVADVEMSRFNFNDGFGGNTVVEGNLVFNMVRETGDHGLVHYTL